MNHALITLCCGRSVAKLHEENTLLRSSVCQYKRAASEAYRDGVSAIARLTRDLKFQQQISLSLGRALDQARKESNQSKREIASLVELAHNDPLTGLLNRRGLAEHLAGIASAFSHAGKEDEISGHHQSLECRVVYIDLDGFKSINDTQGHDKGDEVLKSFADLLRQVFARHADLVVRPGGDEFIVIMPNSDLSTSVKRAQAVLDSMSRNESFRIQGTTTPENSISASIGIAPMVLHAEAGGLSRGMIESLLAKAIKRADHAMLDIKKSGKSGIGIARTNDAD